MRVVLNDITLCENDLQVHLTFDYHPPSRRERIATSGRHAGRLAKSQDMSQFRVSPWITYDPSPDARNEPLVRSNIHFSSMNEDVDMDAPQISTLREEETPEPQPSPSRTSKFRVKLLVNEGKRCSLPSTSTRKQAQAGSEDDEEDEDEEDQLIDDDEDDTQAAPLAPPAQPVASTRGLPAKRGLGRGRGGGRKRGGRAEGASKLVAQPSFGDTLDMTLAGSSTAPGVAAAKKKAAPAKGAMAQRAIRKRPSKLAKAPVAPPQRDDAESIGEGESCYMHATRLYPGTAASSPMPYDEHTPEIDISAVPIISAPPFEDSSLEGVPLPMYPLPSKPFPVQPPQKIGTGFAPVIPLDRSRKSVRGWRQVNREVRGIAGGRWFSRTWVGEKESEFASATSAAVAASAAAAAEREAALGLLAGAGGVALPKLPAIAIAGTTGKHSGRGRAAKLDAASSTASASRAGSANPDGIPQAAAAHHIPKKRKSTSLATLNAEAIVPHVPESETVL
ncbi:hypothetical protein BKA93DRAFT_928236 [Sparassis latifolia]